MPPTRTRFVILRLLCRDLREQRLICARPRPRRPRDSRYRRLGGHADPEARWTHTRDSSDRGHRARARRRGGAREGGRVRRLPHETVLARHVGARDPSHPEAPPTEGHDSMSRAEVLVVDDDSGIRDGLARPLQEWNYGGRTASSAEEAL